MASKLPLHVPKRSAFESLWGRVPPSFLAPILATPFRPFAISAPVSATIRAVKRKSPHPQDAYKLRQAQARKEANLSRQAVLQEQRKKELGDPVRGIPTPFVQSFDTVAPQQLATDIENINLEALKVDPNKPPPSATDVSGENHLNFGINSDELGRALDFSRELTEPMSNETLDGTTPEKQEKERREWERRHENAAAAVQRIASLASGSSQQRTKKNIERIIETFGRHNTDSTLKPKAIAPVTREPDVPAPESTPRVGPDTGSSEVQIGILTAKIRVLADRYEGPNRNDKINKRNLRLLLHRRQKLLAYMEKKERGSERWQHMIKILGLTPACWKGQIAVE
ncbi:hypothetical protein MMC21_003256 [Puttea exsequens]|nr:hypothetical protein [Puttea exsequens]